MMKSTSVQIHFIENAVYKLMKELECYNVDWKTHLMRTNDLRILDTGFTWSRFQEYILNFPSKFV